jgi:hypothetical protein
MKQAIINTIAEIWVANGGDSDGIVWCWRDIKEAVEEIEKDSQ